MNVVAVVLGVAGALLAGVSAVILWRLDPDSSRYATTQKFAGASSPGVKNLVRDTTRAAALAAVGALLTAAGLVVEIAA